MERHALSEWLRSYQSNFPEEQKFVFPFIDLLRQPACYQRTHLPGHLTGSAWIVNADKNKALLVHHAKLNRWMQPGGHADGDENILRVALKETQEETGIMKFQASPVVFDIDIHTIPARTGFPEHLHYDVRFLLVADEADQIVVSEESHDVKWILLSELEKYTDQQSVLRMKHKILNG